MNSWVLNSYATKTALKENLNFVLFEGLILSRNESLMTLFYWLEFYEVWC